MKILNLLTLIFFIFIMMTFSTKSQTSNHLHQLVCINDNLKITIITPWPIPNGQNPYRPIYISHSSKVVLEKSNKIIFSTTVNCKGVIAYGETYET